MKAVQQGAIIVAAIGLASLTGVASAADENTAFFAVSGTEYEIKNLPGAPADSKMPGFSLHLGTYITQYARTELRLGYGLGDVAVPGGLTATVDDYFSWYIGPEYPVTDYLRIYGLFGFSHLGSSASRTEPGSFDTLPDSLVDSSFSMSTAIGFSVRVWRDFHTFLDYGRLHADSITSVDIKQLNLGLRYEY